MRFLRFTLIGILLVILITIISPLAQASFEEDYQTYLKTYDDYRGTYDNYIITRNQYLSFGTLNSKTEALNAVKKFLNTRDDVLLLYIGLLRQKNTDILFRQLLDEEHDFLVTHQQKIPPIAALDDAVRLSSDVEDRHIELQLVSRKVLGTVLTNKVEALKLQWVILQQDALTIVQTLRSQGKNTEVLERWLLDAKNKESVAEQKILQIRTQIAKLKSTTHDQLSDEFNKIQFSIFEANQYMHESINFLLEFAESVKYGNY